MTDPVATLLNLIARFGWTALDGGDSAFGAIGATPVTMTVLTVEPLGLLFAFNVNCDSADLPLPAEFSNELPPETCKVSVENGRAWLSLYNLTGRSADEIAALLDQFHQSLVAAELAVGPGCVRCGCLDEANVIHVEGRTTRICPKCLEQAVSDKLARDAQLNAPSLSALLGLPTSILISAGCWAVLWFGADFVIDWLRIRVVEINQLSVLVLLALYVGTGAALGIPLGKMLRRSGVVQSAPIPLCCVVVLCAVIAGEIGYVALLILWNVGIVNFAAAAQLLGPIMGNYTEFWIANKLFCACAVGAFCVSNAGERKTVSLKI